LITHAEPRELAAHTAASLLKGAVVIQAERLTRLPAPLEEAA
jgi:hypothetical protein